MNTKDIKNEKNIKETYHINKRKMLKKSAIKSKNVIILTNFDKDNII